MKSIYKNHLITVSSIENKAEKLGHLTSLLRSLLQLTVITSFELTKAQAPYHEIDLFEFSQRFCKPVDGLPLQILDSLTPIIRSHINVGFLTGWFEVTPAIKCPLSKQLIQWVEFRNKRPGHGVLDVKNIEEWSKKTENIIKDCLIVFNSIIPSIDDESFMQISREFNNLKIETPIFKNGHAIVILSIYARK